MTLPEDRFTGVLAAALTPVDADFSPDIGRMAAHCNWLLNNGCDGLAILGTTGEANSLSLADRTRIIEGLVEAGVPGSTLIPGTGSCALKDAVELSRTAIAAGARGVLMLPPFYYKNPSDDGLYTFYSEVIQRVGDERLRVYLYHFPQMSATPISYSLIERLTRDYPDTVVGMKDSSGDLDNMLGAVRNFPGFCVLSGSDHLLLPLIREGGGGCITACANVCSPLAAEVYRGFGGGADIDGVNANLVSLREVISRYPLSAALKALMARHGEDEAWLNICPPLRPLSDADAQALFAAFDAVGFEMAAAA